MVGFGTDRRHELERQKKISALRDACEKEARSHVLDVDIAKVKYSEKYLKKYLTVTQQLLKYGDFCSNVLAAIEKLIRQPFHMNRADGWVLLPLLDSFEAQNIPTTSFHGKF